MTKQDTPSNKTSKKLVVAKQAAKARAATSYVEKHQIPKQAVDLQAASDSVLVGALLH